MVGWIPEAAQHLLVMGARGNLAPKLPQRGISRDERFNRKKSWLSMSKLFVRHGNGGAGTRYD